MVYWAFPQFHLNQTTKRVDVVHSTEYVHTLTLYSRAAARALSTYHLSSGQHFTSFTRKSTISDLLHIPTNPNNYIIEASDLYKVLRIYLESIQFQRRIITIHSTIFPSKPCALVRIENENSFGKFRKCAREKASSKSQKSAFIVAMFIPQLQSIE